MPKYAVIYWKSLDKNNVTIKEFDDEDEMVKFIDGKSLGGNAIIVAEEGYKNNRGEKTYHLRPTSAYNFFKRIYIYVGFFLVAIIISIILLWKYDLS